MAFPVSPNDGDLYTTSLNTVYQYQAAYDRWLLYSHTMTGETGVQIGQQPWNGLLFLQV